MSWPGRCAIRSRGLREAGQAACGRRSTRSRVNLLTSRYPLTVDDRAARAGIGLDRWHVAAQPTAPSTRQSPGRHFRAVQRHLSPIVPYWRKPHAADSPGPAETIHPGRHQGRPAGESRFREANCARAPDGPRHGQRRLPGCGRQWLLATAGNMQEHNRDIGSRSSLSDRGRLPVRPRERGTYLTGAWPGMSDRSTARNARRTVTVAGHEIDDLDYCQVAQGGLRGADSRHRTIYRSCQRVLAWPEFLPQLTTPRSAHRPGQPTPWQRPPVPGRPRSRPAPVAGHLAGCRKAPAGRGRRERAAAAGQVRRWSAGRQFPHQIPDLSPRHSPLPGIRAAPGPGSSEAARLRTA